MQVSEVVNASAKLFGREPVGEALENLLTAYNLVEHELALDAFPLTTVEKVSFVEADKIYFSDLNHSVAEIKQIKDYKNNEVVFDVFPEYIKIKKNYEGRTFFVEYNYLPDHKSIDSTSSYDASFLQALKLGVCSEYCLLNGLFTEAKLFSDMFVAKVEQLQSTKNI